MKRTTFRSNWLIPCCIIALLASSQGFSSDTAPAAASSVAPTGKSKLKSAKAKLKKKIQDETPSESETGADEPEASASTPTMGRSAKARSLHKISAGPLYTPLSDYMLSYGAKIGMNQGTDLQFHLNYLGGSKSISETAIDSSGTWESSAKLTGMYLSADARYFLGNSFNLSSGLGYRAATVDYTISGPATVSGKIDISSIVIPFFLGNIWSFDNGLYLGCDWVGVLIPISGSTKSSISGTLTSTQSKSLNDSLVSTGDSLSKRTSITLLLTHLGWAF
jgi:hypothetical protein